MTTCLVYITARDSEEAVGIGRDLVAKRLAACANVHGSIVSIFRWKGDVQEDQESVLVSKTTDDKVEALTARVLEIHSYDCPCVVALPIASGHSEFLDWIAAETFG